MYREYLLCDLIDLAKDENMDAMEEICRRFECLAIKLCRRTYIRGWEMNDLMQTVSMALIKAVKMYKNCGTSFPSYAASAMRRELYYRIRSTMSKPSCCSIYAGHDNGEDFFDAFEIEDKNCCIEEDFVHSEKIEFLKEAVLMLPEKERDLIVECFFHEMSLKEYSKKKGMSYRNAGYIKKKALSRLRSIFDKKY